MPEVLLEVLHRIAVATSMHVWDYFVFDDGVAYPRCAFCQLAAAAGEIDMTAPSGLQVVR